MTLSTPSGVPVESHRPEYKVMNELKYSIRYGMSKIKSRVLPCWVSLPLTKFARPRFAGSGDVRRVDEPGAEDRGAVAILDPHVGAIPVLQIIANGVIVGDAVSRHMLQGLERVTLSRTSGR